MYSLQKINSVSAPAPISRATRFSCFVKCPVFSRVVLPFLVSASVRGWAAWLEFVVLRTNYQPEGKGEPEERAPRWESREREQGV